MAGSPLAGRSGSGIDFAFRRCRSVGSRLLQSLSLPPMTFQQILTLARVPNIPTVWSNVLMAWVLAGGDSARWPALILAMTAGSAVYAGGCTLNDTFDARWDREHKPERLIPSGAVAERNAWILGIMEMTASLALLILLGRDTWWLPLLLVTAILVYDFRHKNNPWSVVVMGACRALLILTAAGIAGNWKVPLVLLAAGVMWIYIIALSLLARRESRPGGGLLKKLRPGWSVGRWVGEMLAAIPLVDALLILSAGLISGSGLNGVCWVSVLICLLLWPLCRLLQRKYAAT